ILSRRGSQQPGSRADSAEMSSDAKHHRIRPGLARRSLVPGHIPQYSDAMRMRRTSYGTLLVAAALVLTSALLVRAQGLPQVLDPPPDAPVQPLPYSHRQHLELGLECFECHVQPDPGFEMT